MEQHGLHTPLGTDTLSTESVVEVGTGAFDGEVIIDPTIPVSVAEEYHTLDGTPWVSSNTFRAYIRETIGSLAHHGFDRIIVVNGHGGSIGALAELCRRVPRTGDIYTVAFTWSDAVDGHSSNMGHGGPLETVSLRHMHLELTREDRIDEVRGEGAGR